MIISVTMVVSVNRRYTSMALKFTMSVPSAMKTALEEERRRRKLDTIQDAIRSILSDYFARLQR